MPLAGVLELPQIPHNLNEVVARSFVVSAAGVRFPHKLTPVEALRAPAGKPQPGVFSLACNDHGAFILPLGVKADGLLPDVVCPAAVSLRLSWPDAAGEQQQRGGLDPHAVSGRVGLLELRVLSAFICWEDRELI